MLTDYLKQSDLAKQNGEKPATKFEQELIALIPTFQRELFADNSIILTLSDIKTIMMYESKRFLNVCDGKHLENDSVEILRALVLRTNSKENTHTTRIAESSTDFFS